MPYDPLNLAEETEKVVVRGDLRKYYREARPGRWYGGIASADCCGCNLRCIFCWSGLPRDSPERTSRFCSAERIFHSLVACAERFGYRQMRVSGNEPTLGRDHLLRLLGLVDRTQYWFILETNGILIGRDAEYAEQLSRFRRVHVRVSIKGTDRNEFSRLTGASPEAFDLQLRALENLVDAGVSCHPAVMLSFSTDENFRRLADRLASIDAKLAAEVEGEYVFLYPHVVRRLRAAALKPIVAYEPDRVPEELV